MRGWQAERYWCVPRPGSARRRFAEQHFTTAIADWLAAGQHALAAQGCNYLGQIRRAQGNLDAPLTYAFLILAGILAIGILPPLLMYRLRKPGWRAAGDGSA